MWSLLMIHFSDHQSDAICYPGCTNIMRFYLFRRYLFSLSIPIFFHLHPRIVVEQALNSDVTWGKTAGHVINTTHSTTRCFLLPDAFCSRKKKVFRLSQRWMLIFYGVQLQCIIFSLGGREGFSAIHMICIWFAILQFQLCSLNTMNTTSAVNHM